MESIARRRLGPARTGVVAIAAAVLFASEVAHAQTDTSTSGRNRGGASAAAENITITGTKKAKRQFASDAPVAVSAFGEEQIDALQFRDIESLTFSVPNVSLDSVGTAKGVANFSIRGLGANSSIPTIDPTVGLFVNGVYFGSNGGAVLDSFDLEGVEVLRGPQGILFGRNVTGGAVLMRTKRPGDTWGANLKFNQEFNPDSPNGGLESRVYAGVDAPILPGLLKFRVAGMFRNDDGWFTNMAPVAGSSPVAPTLEEQQFGAEQTWLIRPTVSFTPTDNFQLHVMYERGDLDAAGPPAQNSLASAQPANAGTFTGFDFSIDEIGFANYEWNHLFAEAILDLGDAGTITDIFGFRTVDGLTRSDIDAQPISLFHADSGTKIQHISNELRYQGDLFDDFLDLTVGLYVFQQRIEYRERRLLLGVAVPTDPQAGAIDSTYGGNQDQFSLGVFTQLELNFTDTFSGILGGRVTYEEKTAEVATFSAAGGPCPNLNVDFNCDGNYTFNDSANWFNFSPKVGAQWAFAKDNQLYGHWTRGFRSGGYNLRNTSADPMALPGPFNEEQQDAFELGLKSALFDRRLRFGVSGFFTVMNDLQREVNIPAAGAGVVQIIRNTANANVYGVELDATVVAFSNFVIRGSFGYTDSEYTEVRFDLNGDGMVNDADKDLTLPRLANITANIGGVYDLDLGGAGIVTARANYAYRDSSFFTDNNLGLLPSGHVIDASIAYTLPEIDLGASYIIPMITLYGRNLADQAFLGGQTVLPPALAPMTPALGGNFSPLKEGRSFGVEVRVDWE